MWMHSERDIGGIRTHFDGESNLGDQVASRRSDNAATDHAFGGLVEDQLGESLTAAQRQGTSAGGPREAAFSVRDARGFRFVLGHPDPCHLWIGVGDRRNDPRVAVALLTTSDLGGNMAFVGRLVR